jgi:hypothetical protein
MCHILGSVTWAGIGHLLSALLTPLIAAIAVSIAWQQYVVNHRQHRLALFEKRMAVFNSTMKMIGSVMQTANADLSQCFQFIKDTRDHEFLFGPEVGKFINEVYQKAVALHAHTQMRSSDAAQLTEILNWFFEQSGEARKIFLRYMDFRDP